MPKEKSMIVRASASVKLSIQSRSAWGSDATMAQVRKQVEDDVSRALNAMVGRQNCGIIIQEPITIHSITFVEIDR